MHAIFTGHELSDKVIEFETDRGRNICEYRLTATQKDEADRRLQEIHTCGVHELSDKVIKFETDRGRNICEYRLTATQKDEADRRLQEIHTCGVWVCGRHILSSAYHIFPALDHSCHVRKSHCSSHVCPTYQQDPSFGWSPKPMFRKVS